MKQLYYSTHVRDPEIISNLLYMHGFKHATCFIPPTIATFTDVQAVPVCAGRNLGKLPPESSGQEHVFEDFLAAGVL